MINQTLETILKAETESLRVQYIELTKKYAAEEFANITKIANRPHPNWDSFATPGFAEKFGNSRIDYEQGKKFRKATDLRYKCNEIVSKGFDVYESRLVKLADLHYEDSITKLAIRIEKKELDQSKLSVVTSHIGQNIETILTDGTKTVRAFTIIASGPVQKPHYRYLIK
jgi:hypothetical protein